MRNALTSLRTLIFAAGFCLVYIINPALCQGVKQEQSPQQFMMSAGQPSPALGFTTSEKTLIGYFGARNVKRQKVNLPEGETADGTVVFADDLKRRVTFIWKDAKARNIAEVIRIEDQPSLWHLRNNITIGTKLTELEKLNGKPFKLSGFDWDYGGNVLSWNSGRLEKILKCKSGIATINMG